MGDGTTKQKEWFSRAGVIAAAASAGFSYAVVTDDDHGVDMTVHGGEHVIDFQLKSTSSPTVQNGFLLHDLDVRTYNLLSSTTRAGYGVLALVVVGGETDTWIQFNDDAILLRQTPYFLPLYGMPPTSNRATIRLKVPMSNLLTTEAMKDLMAAQAARWSVA